MYRREKWHIFKSSIPIGLPLGFATPYLLCDVFHMLEHNVWYYPFSVFIMCLGSAVLKQMRYNKIN